MNNLFYSVRLNHAAIECRWLKSLLACATLAVCPIAANAQTEMLFNPIGMDNQFVFPHMSLPGATGIDFSFTGAFSPMYPAMVSHTVVITFEWGPTVTGPWTSSPDNVNTVPGGTTDFFATGIYNGPDDAPFVAIHFYAGGLMTASGEFTHTSVVPEPSALLLAGMGLMALLPVARRLRAKAA